MMLISLTSRLRAPVAISHPVRAVSPVKSSFEKLVSAGNVRVVSLGRSFRISVCTDSNVVDDMDSKPSTSMICRFPVTSFRPLSVISSIPFAATVTFPVNAVHWLSVVTSSGLLIANVPEEGAQSVVGCVSLWNGLNFAEGVTYQQLLSHYLPSNTAKEGAILQRAS
jgi:hypothetical protein